MADPTIKEVLSRPPKKVSGPGLPGYDQYRAEAAIHALRAGGRHNALLDDAGNVGLRGAYALTDGSMGVWGLHDEDKVRLYGMADQIRKQHQDYGYTPFSDLQTVGAHEGTHALQAPWRAHSTYKDRRYPGEIYGYMLDKAGVLDRINQNYKIGEEDPRDFRNMLTESKANYSPNELAARFAAELGYGDKNIMSEIVDKAYRKYPGLSLVFGQRNMQPNRAMPTHFKGEPEWTPDERKAFEKTGVRPSYSIEDMVKIQGDLIRERWARENGSQ